MARDNQVVLNDEEYDLLCTLREEMYPEAGDEIPLAVPLRNAVQTYREEHDP